MNKLYRLPLRMRSKTQLADPRHRRKSTNLVLAGILVVGALFALAAIGLIVFGAFRHRTDMPKEVGITPAPAVADVSPAESKDKENDAVMPLANPNPTLPSRSTIDQQTSASTSAPVVSATPLHSSTPATTPTSTALKHEQKTETDTRNAEKPLTKTARQNTEKKRQEAETDTGNPEKPLAKTAHQNPEKKRQEPETDIRNAEKPLTKTARLNLEKKRQEAERKRAQLEEEYQNHEISADAYNKGEEEYRNEIQKYRNELRTGT